MDKAEIVFEKIAIGAMGVATGALIAGSLAPKPRKTATSIATPAGKNIKMKKMVNLPKTVGKIKLPKTDWRVKTDK